jgi:predicted negative regulator of RcsB-dependent stress response
MTFLLILVVLSVAGYVAYKITKSKVPSINSVDSFIADTLQKVTKDIEEVVAEAEKIAPKNEVIKTAAKAAKKVSKPKNSK